MTRMLWICEWEQLWSVEERDSPCFIFNPLSISLQGGPYQGGYFEIDVRVLGLGFNWSWHRESNEHRWERIAADVRERVEFDNWKKKKEPTP